MNIGRALIAFVSSLYAKGTNAENLAGTMRLYLLDGDLKDSSGNGENLSPAPKDGVNSGITFPVDTPFGTQPRQVACFAGLGRARASAAGLPGGSKPRTIAGWFKLTGPTESGPFGYGRNGCSNAYYTYIKGPDSNVVSLDQWCQEDGINYIFTATKDQWYHLVIMYDGSQNKAYVDGNLAASGTPNVAPTTIVDSSGSTVIGGNPHSVDSTGRVFTGCIANFAIYDRALTPTEVLSIYQNPSVKKNSNSEPNNVDSALISCASQRCVELTEAPINELVPAESEYGVKCCSDTEIIGFNLTTQCSLWVTSRDTNGTCARSATYFEAVTMCTEFGARICTVEENLSDCTRKAKCSLNDKKVWAVGNLSPVQSPPSGEAGTPTPTTPSIIAPTPVFVPTPSIGQPTINQWFIFISGNATDTPISNDEILISVPFITSDEDHGALVFESDCITPFNSDSYFEVDTSPPVSIGQDGFIGFDTTLKMNITAVRQSEYWNPFIDGTSGGWIEACTETYLNFTDEFEIENVNLEEKVDFKNVLLNISVSLTTSFEVEGVELEREDVAEKGVDIDYSDLITAYECEENNLYQPVTGKTYNQGDEIMICVTDESPPPGMIQVDEFYSIKVSQDGTPDYNYIVNSIWNPRITTPVCLDGPSTTQRRVCYAKLRVLARFFEVENTPDLTITGRISVVLASSEERRNLRMSNQPPEKMNVETTLTGSGDSTNKDVGPPFDVSGDSDSKDAEAGLDIDDGAGSGVFLLKITLKSAVDSAASSIAGTSTSGLVSMVIGAVGVAGVELIV